MDFRKIIVDRSPSLSARALRWTLRLGSPLYRAVMGLRNLFYDLGIKKSYRSPIPVISVGNLSVGGTGKSPAVMWLTQQLRQQHKRVAILSRGYGALADGQNDEALEIESRLPDVPHLQNWDRVANAILAHEELDMEVLVLDDGFQHRRLRRDLDFVLIDATDPASAHWTLPGGLLREPFSALRRADCVCLTRTSQADPQELERLRRRISKIAPSTLLLHSNHAPSALWHSEEGTLPIEQLDGASVLAFCGIGNPDSFFHGLAEAGAQVIATRTWPDHHAYTAKDVEELQRWGAEHPEAGALVCTMKDWVKLQVGQLGNLPLKALLVEFQVEPGEELDRFHEMLAAKCSQLSA